MDGTHGRAVGCRRLLPRVDVTERVRLQERLPIGGEERRALRSERKRNSASPLVERRNRAIPLAESARPSSEKREPSSEKREREIRIRAHERGFLFFNLFCFYFQ